MAALIDFIFIDPTRVRPGGLEGAVVFVVHGIMTGNPFPADLEPVELAQVINHNLLDLTHLEVPQGWTDRPELVAGTVLFTYCSRCGYTLVSDVGCSICQIEFTLGPNEHLVALPTVMPTRVLRYTRQLNWEFTHEPPNA